MFIGTKNEFWLKLLLLNALKNKALIASYFHFLLECTSEEAQEVGCLHGGSCFAVEIAGVRHTACHCTAEFTGKRCQYQAIDPELLSSGH